ASVQKAVKKLKLQMAVSEYRQGKWTPEKVSKDFAESAPYNVEIVRKHYRFFPIDRSEVDGRFGIKYEGYSLGSDFDRNAELCGELEMSRCSGGPETTDFLGYFEHAILPERNSTGDDTAFLKWVELVSRRAVPPKNDFTLENVFYERYRTQPGIVPFTPV